MTGESVGFLSWVGRRKRRYRCPTPDGVVFPKFSSGKTSGPVASVEATGPVLEERPGDGWALLLLSHMGRTHY